MSRLVGLEIRAGQSEPAGLCPVYAQVPSLDGVVDLAWVHAQELGRFGNPQDWDASGVHDISAYPTRRYIRRALRS